jgi:hypothetical protein
MEMENSQDIVTALGQEKGLLLLCRIIDELILQHPLPWIIDQDWTSMVKDAKGIEVFHNCPGSDDDFMTLSQKCGDSKDTDWMIIVKGFGEEKSLRLLSKIIDELMQRYRLPWEKRSFEGAIESKDGIVILSTCVFADELLNIVEARAKKFESESRTIEKELGFGEGTLGLKT